MTNPKQFLTTQRARLAERWAPNYLHVEALAVALDLIELLLRKLEELNK